ncbi:hypothetical protein LWI28_014570 [Acer negundo]|uniref:Serine carboxypeptidase n=1 Tax=Acer negundo TaxID=4023 RepID=A0AAD5NT51_ACENE|nr:hypothetical protein LWI28_014570 [Acer negundo]
MAAAVALLSCSCVVAYLLLGNVFASHSIIKNLPGFPGDLPFKLETGYIGVGELDEVQLFYYFIESERSPEDDPLVLWLTGGPGCSAFSGLVYEIGPLSFDYENSKGNIPKFLLNPYSWTKVANIIFLDQPVGTGFSYATTWQAYNMKDTLSTKQTYTFLRKWLIDHPTFLSNELYVAGDSYSGITVPVVVQEISDEEQGTIKQWVRCNSSLSYTKDVPTSLVYHQNLIKKGYQVLIYSGDHDIVIPYVGTEKWIKSLNLTIQYGWQPWLVDGQVAGYSVVYSQKDYHLTFATGGGHTAPEYKPKECLAMIFRWFAEYPL